MKAYVLNDINKLDYMDVPVPKTDKNWALVKVMASGICSSDIPRIFTKGTYHFPTIPGHEFSGVVESVNDEINTKWIGKRVCVFPLIPCFQCEQCKIGQYQRCKNYDYIGSRRDGAFAEYVSVPIWNLIELPDNVSFELGALIEPMSVALHAIKASSIVDSQSIAIVGTGLIGICAGIWAKHFGSTNIMIVGRNTSKKELIESFGMNFTLAQDSYKSQYDIVIEAVGSNQSLSNCVNLCKDGGQIILMGNPESDMALSQKNYWQILRRELLLKGIWNSQYEYEEYCEWAQTIELLSKMGKQLKNLITQEFPSNELMNALSLMKDKKSPYCKVMIRWQ